MALPEVKTTLVQKETIPFFVREAVERVPVDEYLQLRYQSKRGDFNEVEYRQISDGVGAIISKAAKLGKRTYDPSDKIEFSADPRVIGARLILTNLPLPKYLTARHEVLEAAIARNSERIRYYTNLDKLEAAEEAQIRGQALVADLNLTNRVAFAVELQRSAA